ncbi:hypothetical protein HGA91_03790 [candidate division WWE3 bacterium]|nr:hypothetical protein [candidate division WWE3 bacterium]
MLLPSKWMYGLIGFSILTITLVSGAIYKQSTNNTEQEPLHQTESKIQGLRTVNNDSDSGDSAQDIDESAIEQDSLEPTITDMPTITPIPTDQPPTVTAINTPVPTNTPRLQPTAIPTVVPTNTPRPIEPTARQAAYVCDCSKTCKQISTCQEAQYQLTTCNCTARDGDDDGIACDGAPLNCQR